MVAPYTGGCQCGQIRYEIRAEHFNPVAVTVKMSSNLPVPGVMPVPRDAVVILKDNRNNGSEFLIADVK